MSRTYLRGTGPILPDGTRALLTVRKEPAEWLAPGAKVIMEGSRIMFWDGERWRSPREQRYQVWF